MKILALLLLSATLAVAAPPNYERLANCIYIHEGGLKTRFPYGCEHRVNGKLEGFPEPIARARCIALCKKVFAAWNGKGDYFQVLNKTYALDPIWYKDVEKKYFKKS